MQFDSLRAFPYPVLRPDVDDYIDGDIQVTVEFEPSADGQEVIAEVTFHLSVKELQEEVEAGRAQYTTVFACRDTYFRHVHASGEESFKVTFPAGRLRGEVQVFPYIASVKPITDYKSKLINSEFGPGPFRYEIGSVLAVDRPQIIYIDRDVFRPLSSVFVLIGDDSIVGHEWQVRTTDDKVWILVSLELKELIDKARNNKANRAVLMNSIYFSAVMHCISILRAGSEDNDSRWAKVMRQKCHNEGINIEDHDDYLITEKLMRSPFQLIEAYVFQGVGQ
ncbi:hypothetical protein [Mesorhizobium sp.]|uniref:hypothetical protein n=1 Tax=Mesorhizobium sp. TaxID=1871066 RepID=UPI000FE84DCE|nr:hypothetical protein [Mesorhizobium sp.]RWI04341.1 MAG: hypothetical protein EOQ90_30690 [Mesorhizobium sp.]RWM87931.1 MAG: hypothetical protein EOR83_00065 [Mesorhizobium sp.]TJW50005.1 MAG: hypothetical protein E5X65_30900 [Mesorhizobium sp.]